VINELGQRLTPPQVAKMTGINARVVRKNYASLGGFILDGRIYFYEEAVKNAIQDKIKRSMDGTGENRRGESLSASVQNEKRSDRVGTEGKRKNSSSGTGEGRIDPHGVLA
jgi:hypothetical protein